MKHIPLTRGAFALVDDADFERLVAFPWHLTSNGYAATDIRKPGSRKYVLMHRLVIDAAEGKDVDHISGDKLDNRRQNLRECSRSENMGNRRLTKGRRFKGVFQDGDKYHAKICVGGRSRHLGSFDTPEEAATAYDSAALQEFGQFARPNGNAA